MKYANKIDERQTMDENRKVFFTKDVLVEPLEGLSELSERLSFMELSFTDRLKYKETKIRASVPKGYSLANIDEIYSYYKERRVREGEVRPPRDFWASSKNGIRMYNCNGPIVITRREEGVPVFDIVFGVGDYLELPGNKPASVAYVALEKSEQKSDSQMLNRQSAKEKSQIRNHLRDNMRFDYA